MIDLIPPVAKDRIIAELTEDKFIRKTNNGSNLIYVITHKNSPDCMREIGRLRELTFRMAGGGTGKEIDIDAFDISDNPYRQLIVWNPQENEIVGGYRYLCCSQAVDAKGEIKLATTELFEFSEKFKKEYLPFTIELGRSFVQPQFQPSSENRKGLFSLDNLWDGLGALIVDNPQIRYLYGKVTMYTDFNVFARDMILTFMNHYFPDKEKLVWPYYPLIIKNDMRAFLKSLAGLNYKDGHRILNQQVRALAENIPPLVNSYMNISPSMKTFGTAVNKHFGEVEETGILVTIADIYSTKKERHLTSYNKHA
jgi:hypothetical protein